MRAFVDFALEDPARCELLFQRPIPGFEPSPESYAHARRCSAAPSTLLHAAGLRARATSTASSRWSAA